MVKTTLKLSAAAAAAVIVMAGCGDADNQSLPGDSNSTYTLYAYDDAIEDSVLTCGTTTTGTETDSTGKVEVSFTSGGCDTFSFAGGTDVYTGEALEGTITGDVTIGTVASYLTTYLVSLPATEKATAIESLGKMGVEFSVPEGNTTLNADSLSILRAVAQNINYNVGAVNGAAAKVGEALDTTTLASLISGTVTAVTKAFVDQANTSAAAGVTSATTMLQDDTTISTISSAAATAMETLTQTTAVKLDKTTLTSGMQTITKVAANPTATADEIKTTKSTEENKSIAAAEVFSVNPVRMWWGEKDSNVTVANGVGTWATIALNESDVNSSMGIKLEYNGTVGGLSDNTVKYTPVTFSTTMKSYDDNRSLSVSVTNIGLTFNNTTGNVEANTTATTATIVITEVNGTTIRVVDNNNSKLFSSDGNMSTGVYMGTTYGAIINALDNSGDSNWTTFKNGGFSLGGNWDVNMSTTSTASGFSTLFRTTNVMGDINVTAGQ